MTTYEQIKGIIHQRNIRWTTHCLEKMGERDISISDVMCCLTNGEMIEDYPDDYPYPSCLIFGITIDGRVIHAVAGTDGETVYVITAYYPNTAKFEGDLRTRRR